MDESASRSRRISRNTFFLYGSEMLARVFSWGTFAFLTRHWSEISTYGQYALIVNWIAVFATFSDLGLNALTIREVAYQKERASFYLRNVLALRFSFGLLILALLWVLGKALHYEAIIQAGLVVLGLRIFLDCLSGGYVYLLQAHEWMGLHGSIVAAGSFLRFVGLVGLAWIGAGVVDLCWVWVTVSGLTLLALVWIGFHRKWVPQYQGWTAKEAVEILRNAVPLAAFGALQTLYYRVDEVILKSLSGNEAVGYYDAAYKVLNVVFMMSQMFGLATFPVLASLKDRVPEFGRVLLRSIKILFFLSLPIMVGGYLLAKPILVFISGDKYAFSGDLFAILCVSAVPFFLSNIYINVLMVHRPKLLNIVYFTLFVLNGALNFWWVPHFGAEGAAWATVVCEGVGILWGLILIHPYWKEARNVSMVGPILASVASSATMGVLIHFDPRLYWLCAGPLVYGFGLWMLRGITPDDWKSLKSVLKMGQNPN